MKGWSIPFHDAHYIDCDAPGVGVGRTGDIGKMDYHWILGRWSRVRRGSSAGVVYWDKFHFFVTHLEKKKSPQEIHLSTQSCYLCKSPQATISIARDRKHLSEQILQVRCARVLVVTGSEPVGGCAGASCVACWTSLLFVSSCCCTISLEHKEEGFPLKTK